MVRHRWMGAACALVIVAASSRARADPFGKEGQISFDDLLGLRAGPQLAAGAVGLTPYTGVVGFAHEKETGGGATSSYDSIWFDPSVDLFLEHRISIGMEVGVEYDRLSTSGGGTPAASSSALEISVTPRIGYAIPITDSITFWPRVLGGYGHTLYFDESGGDAGHVNAWTAGTELGLVFVAGDHLYFDLAPVLVYATSSSGGAHAESMRGGLHAKLGLRF